MSVCIMFYASIMAGGTGTRLWPVSRKSTPKQVKPFMDDKTLLQKTYNRLLPKFGKDCIWIATNESQIPFVNKQISNFPSEQISAEPAKRDTAAAIGLATLRIFAKDPDASIININSDAYIIDEEEYLRIITEVEKFLEKNREYIVGVGISPTYPETGYGYIKKGKKLFESKKDTIYEVAQFTEKPGLTTASQYIASGDYLWNPTLFAWKAAKMLDLFKEHSPEIYNKLMEIEPFIGTDKEEQKISEIYPTMPSISIDYAIFEKAENMAVIPGNFGWSDVGNWKTLYDLQDKDDNKNVTKGDVIVHKSEGNLIYSQAEKVVAVVGLKNFVVVDTKEALLICDKDNAQDVKKIVNKLKDKGLEKYL